LNEYIMAWDIAQKRDFTTGIVVKRSTEIIPGSDILKSPDRSKVYADIVAIDKFNNVPYTQVADIIENRMGHVDLRNSCDLLVDGTGIGAAVVDLLREKGLNPNPIVFTGGGQVREVTAPFGTVFKNSPGQLSPLKIIRELHVPKNDLSAAGKILMEQDRVSVVPGLRWGEDFKTQMLAFRGKVNERTGRKKYEAETEGDHDDMVVTYLMIAWWILRGGTKSEERILPAAQDEAEWSPADHY